MAENPDHPLEAELSRMAARDAETKHDPATGQFTSGSGGGSGKGNPAREGRIAAGFKGGTPGEQGQIAAKKESPAPSKGNKSFGHEIEKMEIEEKAEQKNRKKEKGRPSVTYTPAGQNYPFKK
jgi:hypothetical protein